MPILIPDKFHGQSKAEEEAFNAVKSLDDSYTVFHSTHWIDSTTGYEGEGDLIICHPDKGILVIEIKGGQIELKNGKFRQISTKDFISREIQDPLQQANRTKHHLIKVLRDVIPKSESCYVGAAAWFTGGKAIGEFPLNYDKELILTSDDLYYAPDSIKKIFDHISGFSNYRHSLTKRSYADVIEKIGPEFSIVPNYKKIYDETEEEFTRLTKDQMLTLDLLRNQKKAVIEGAAGTGKTILAIEKAKRLRAQHDRVLFLCYNRALCDHLAEVYSETGVEFKTFHLLATELLGKENVSDYNKLIDEFCLASLDHLEDWIWDHVVVDEGQDFKQEWLDIINDYAKETVFIFYDPQQNLYGKTLPEGILSIENKFPIVTNCRNTRQIAEFCKDHSGIDYESYLNEIAGKVPEEKEVRNIEELIYNINAKIKDYQNKGIDHKDIVILSMKGEQKSDIIPRQIDLIKNVRTTTVRKFKGLESRIVIICEVEKNKLNWDNYKRLLYVGASRARFELIVFYEGEEYGIK